VSKDIERVCARFERQLRAGLGTRRSDNDLARQAKNFRRGIAPYVEMEMPVRQILNESGVSVIQYALYFNFSRRLAKLKKEYSANTLVQEAWLAVSHWTRQGLKPEILKTICYVVFNLDLDRHPPEDLDCAQRQAGQQAGRSDGRPDGTGAAMVPERR
jgi:hypothetical protein